MHTDLYMEHNNHYQSIKVECILALKDTQTIIALNCPINSSVQDAINLIYQIDPEIFNAINLLLKKNDAKIGIYSQIVSLDYLLKTGDRIEIYRTLTVDPKLARLRRSQIKNIRKF